MDDRDEDTKTPRRWSEMMKIYHLYLIQILVSSVMLKKMN